jgi:hypothetical protein
VKSDTGHTWDNLIIIIGQQAGKDIISASFRFNGKDLNWAD